MPDHLSAVVQSLHLQSCDFSFITLLGSALNIDFQDIMFQNPCPFVLDIMVVTHHVSTCEVV